MKSQNFLVQLSVSTHTSSNRPSSLVIKRRCVKWVVCCRYLSETCAMVTAEFSCQITHNAVMSCALQPRDLAARSAGNRRQPVVMGGPVGPRLYTQPTMKHGSLARPAACRRYTVGTACHPGFVTTRGFVMELRTQEAVELRPSTANILTNPTSRRPNSLLERV